MRLSADDRLGMSRDGIGISMCAVQAPMNRDLPHPGLSSRPSRDAETDPDRDAARLLGRMRAGDGDAEGLLIALLYKDLRALAARRMRRERPDHTWQPTELVNEALLRLRRDGTLEKATDRAFLLMAASKAMHQLLVDHHRRHSAEKRGGRRRKHPLDAAFDRLARVDEINPVDLRDELEALGRLDERARAWSSISGSSWGCRRRMSRNRSGFRRRRWSGTGTSRGRGCATGSSRRRRHERPIDRTGRPITAGSATWSTAPTSCRARSGRRSWSGSAPTDPALRAEVLRLLEQLPRARAEGFLEHGASATASTEATEDYRPGEPSRRQPDRHRQVSGRPPLRRGRAARRPPTSPSTPTWNATSS